MRESIFEKAKRAKENKKGFTLVELIVVLVILAILAAILGTCPAGMDRQSKRKTSCFRRQGSADGSTDSSF